MTEGNPSPNYVARETLNFYRQTLEWLKHHHESFALNTSHDLAENERHNAVWKLSGQAIAYAWALVELLERGYTGQTWALMRALDEVDRLLAAVTDEHEERIVRRWLANQEVKQKDAREASRAKRLASQNRWWRPARSQSVKTSVNSAARSTAECPPLHITNGQSSMRASITTTEP